MTRRRDEEGGRKEKSETTGQADRRGAAARGRGRGRGLANIRTQARLSSLSLSLSLSLSPSHHRATWVKKTCGVSSFLCLSRFFFSRDVKPT